VISDSVSDARLVEAWGPGTEFGALRVSDSEMYWYGYFRHPAGAVFDDELAAAQEHFASWAPWVRAFVNSTSSEQLMRHDVYHLRPGPPTYSRGRVVLVGDAAHAALPTSGQGAASALEDAVCVGRMIADPVRAGADLGDALSAFDRARRPRCRQIARTGEMIARLGADVGGGWRQTARNSLLRLVPVRPFLRVGSSVVRWTPP
jgi:2-polyprenyl-6-methoxyphenol hydroxylase-like FAD-dependent oxidoreductase